MTCTPPLEDHFGMLVSGFSHLPENARSSNAMAGFVNYGQRGVQLPLGCKDLVDVLKRTREIVPDFSEWASISGWMPAGAQPEYIDQGSLGCIEKHVTRLLTARWKPSFTVIQVGAFPFQLFCETEAGPLVLLLAFPEKDSERERAIRGFFRDRCIDPVPDHLPGRPGWLVIRYALPCVIGPATALMITLLRSAYAISEDTPLHFLFGSHPGGFW